MLYFYNKGLSWPVPVIHFGFLNLMITAPFPFGWVFHHTGPDHVKIHIHQATPEVFTGFNRRGMIPVLPEGALAALAPIVLLTRPACNQLHGSGYGFLAAVGGNDKVDMVGSGYEIQNGQLASLFRFKQQFNPASTV